MAALSSAALAATLLTYAVTHPDVTGGAAYVAGGFCAVAAMVAAANVNWFYPRPSRDTLMILERIAKMDANIAALKQSFDTYTAKVDAYVAAAEQHKVDVAKAVEDAVKADDADEAVDLDALKVAIESAAAKVPTPPVAPPFDPSANG